MKRLVVLIVLVGFGCDDWCPDPRSWFNIDNQRLCLHPQEASWNCDDAGVGACGEVEGTLLSTRYTDVGPERAWGHRFQYHGPMGDRVIEGGDNAPDRVFHYPRITWPIAVEVTTCEGQDTIQLGHVSTMVRQPEPDRSWRTIEVEMNWLWPARAEAIPDRRQEIVQCVTRNQMFEILDNDDGRISWHLLPAQGDWSTTQQEYVNWAYDRLTHCIATNVGETVDRVAREEGARNPEVWCADPVRVPDTDRDQVNDDVDNCPNRPNPNQGDYDDNGVGDACDFPLLPLPEVTPLTVEVARQSLVWNPLTHSQQGNDWLDMNASFHDIIVAGGGDGGMAAMAVGDTVIKHTESLVDNAVGAALARFNRQRQANPVWTMGNVYGISQKDVLHHRYCNAYGRVATRNVAIPGARWDGTRWAPTMVGDRQQSVYPDCYIPATESVDRQNRQIRTPPSADFYLPDWSFDRTEITRHYQQFAPLRNERVDGSIRRGMEDAYVAQGEATRDAILATYRRLERFDDWSRRRGSGLHRANRPR